MPIFEYKCLDCDHKYELLVRSDNQEIACTKCGSKNKVKLFPSRVSFTFANPVGTDVWNNSHDYRFHHNLPKVKAEREAAEKFNKGKNPYNEIDDFSNDSNFGEVK